MPVTRLGPRCPRAGALRALAISLVLLALLVPAGCGGNAAGPDAAGSGEDEAPAAEEAAPAEGAAPTRGGTLVVAVSTEPPHGFDPHKVESAAAFQIAVNIFDTLVRATPEGELEPGLAEQWRVSDDGRTYTFRIRENAYFHSGREVTARDAAFSLRRLLDPDTAAPRRGDYASISEVRVPDERTLVLETDRPDPALLPNLANGNAAIVPRAAVDDLSRAPVGSGPFRFREWTPGSHIVLERFEDHWDGDLPHLERVEFRLIPDAATAAAALRAGDVDMIPRMSGEEAVRLQQQSGYRVVSGPQNLVQIMAMNNARAPFDDPLVRRAVSYAVDKQEIIEGAAWGYGTPLGTHMSPVLPFYNAATEEVYDRDPERARRLLADAGHDGGFEATLRLPQNYKLHVRTGEILASQLQEVGVDLELELVEWGNWVDDVYVGRNYQLTVIGHTGRLDPAALLGRYASDHGSNYFNYADPEVDRLLEEGRRTVGFAERKSIYDRVQLRIAEDAANLFIQDPHVLAGMQAQVRGYRIYPLYVVDLREVYLAEE